MTLATREIMQLAPVIPVMVIDRVEDAVPLANALVAGGLKVLEITLRTPAALESIRLIKQAVPDAVVGAGTIVNVGNLHDALAAGAGFIVTPGTTAAIVDACVEAGVPLLPGVNTPSEAMTLLERGFDCLKFFPAEAAGGVAMLKALGGPLPQLRFCPTGGITPANAPSYLALANVSCVGGSWMAPAELVQAGDWAEIERRAAQAALLGAAG